VPPLGVMRHSSSVIELRVLTPGDWAVWRELRLAALAEAPYAFGSRLSDWTCERDREERWRARLGIPGSFNVVAVVDGQPTGMASGLPAGEGVAELISMWVSPAARGQGVGDQLVEAVEQWARRELMTTLRLAVTEDNQNAAALYRRKGFTLTGELGDLMPDGVRREHIMAKSLRRG
jgi:ribosomal protein S18 acetylase RimI-like enzyme